jgi:hypothetical protein
MGTLYKSALIHSCDTAAAVQPEASLKVGVKYVRLDEDPREITSMPLDGTGNFLAFKDKRCNCSFLDFSALGYDNVHQMAADGISYKCRKYISLEEAERQLKIGDVKVVWTLNNKKERMQPYTEKVNEKEKRDGEWRGTGRTLTVYHFWKRQQSRVPRVDLITAKDIKRAYLEETKQSVELIEEIHEMLMLNRLDLFDPKIAKELRRLYYGSKTQSRKQVVQKANEIKAKAFKDDPTEGRLIFPFPSDERTKGGHKG